MIRQPNNFSFYGNMLAITSGTITAEIATLPICTIKTKYQNTGNLGIVNTAKNIYSNYGVKGFYNSSIPALSSQILSTGSKYIIYQKCNKDYGYNRAVSGALSGLLGSIVVHPFDTVKIHQQMGTPFIPAFKASGYNPLMLWRGYSKTVLKYSVGGVCFLPIFEYCKERINTPTAALISSIVSTTICQPLDYMKVRQIYGLSIFSNSNPWYIKQYYKGLTLNLIRVVPHFTISMVITDYMYSWLTT